MSIIWITGLPNAGRASVADEVANLLCNQGRVAIHLDGAQMRALFGWTQVKAELDRIALGIRYVRLAQELAQQGALVVMSVVGLHREVFSALLKAERPSAEVVLIDAPDEELLRRDKRAIYTSVRLAELRSQLNVLPQRVLRIQIADCTAHSTAQRLLAHLLTFPIPTGLPAHESMHFTIERLARDEALSQQTNLP